MFSLHILFSASLQKTQRTAIIQQAHCDVCSNTLFESFAHALCGSNKALTDLESSFKSALELFWRQVRRGSVICWESGWWTYVKKLRIDSPNGLMRRAWQAMGVGLYRQLPHIRCDQIPLGFLF